MDVVKTSKAYVAVPKVYLSSVANPKKIFFGRRRPVLDSRGRYEWIKKNGRLGRPMDGGFGS